MTAGPRQPPEVLVLDADNLASSAGTAPARTLAAALSPAAGSGGVSPDPGAAAQDGSVPAAAALDPAALDPAAPGQVRSLPVPEGLEGERLDGALARLFGLSRTRAAELIAADRVTLDGRGTMKSDRVTSGAWLEVNLPPVRPALAVTAQLVPELTVVFDDADLVVVNKPVGVAAHPAPGWSGPTVVGALAGRGYAIATSGAAERQGVVHRLDVGTSGLMVVAKSEGAYSALKHAFKERTVTKIYHAMVQGHPDPFEGTIDAPIGRHPSGDGRWAVTSAGKPSVTHYRVLEAFRAASLMRVQLETGRTHQIRVHFSAVRHPCVGDTTYGADPTLAAGLGLQRQWLHAAELGFAHPATGEPVHFQAEYPTDLAAALAAIRG